MALEEVDRCRRCRLMRPGSYLTQSAKTSNVTGREINFCLLITTLLIYLQGLRVTECLVIDNLVVPRPLINGSMPAIILDCDFKYVKADRELLVIQWFYNHSKQPIYQWIPPKKPEAQGEFKNRLDLEHKISDDPFTMHRALRILHPTVELSGNYKCLVTSAASEDAKNKSLVVYVPADRLEINVTKPNDYTVNVSCISEGGYPEPLISLVMYRNDSQHPEKVDNLLVNTLDDDEDGHTDVIGYRVLEDRHLARKMVFECVLAIADAEYKETERYIYFPGLSSTPRPLSHTNSQVLLTAFISTESSLIDIHVGAGTSGLVSSRLLTATATIVSITASTTFMFLRYNTFRS